MRESIITRLERWIPITLCANYILKDVDDKQILDSMEFPERQTDGESRYNGGSGGRGSKAL